VGVPKGDDGDRDPESRDGLDRRAISGRLIIALAVLTEVVQFVDAILDLVR
jgi:hypothetical protein